MLGPKKTLDVGGSKVVGQSVDFESKSENWNQYILEDGSTLRLKTVLLEVVRLERYNEKNEPVYQFTAQNIVGIQVPDSLKKKAE